MAENNVQLGQLTPAIDRLKAASDNVGSELTDLLFNVTDEMIREFSALRERIALAESGGGTGLPPSSPPPSFPPQSQSIPVPEPRQMPPVQQMAPVEQLAPVQQFAPNMAFNQNPLSANSPGTAATQDGLQPILEAVVAEEPDAMERLTDYARANIVEKAYAHAQAEWSERIRPTYLETLDAFLRQTRTAADGVPPGLSDTAAMLRKTATDISDARKGIEEIEITSDASVDAALGTDWWRTVQGKGAYADAIADSIQTRMMSIAEKASSPADAIRTSIKLQEKLRDQLIGRQKDLESQFNEQRKQLASLSGVTSAIPIDLASFIGLFPLVIGLVLGFMMMRVAQARQAGAQAAADLAGATSEDLETRRWLVRRLLGGGTVTTALVAVSLAVGIIAWIGLAVLQVRDASIETPLPPWFSGLLAVLAVLLAAIRDIAAIRKLGLQASR